MSKMAKFGELTSQQLMAIELLAAKRGSNMKYSEIAESVGISERTLGRWRQSPDFQAELRRRTLEVAGNALPDVLHVLTKKALSGHTKSIELYLKAVGVLGDKQDHTVRPQEDSRSDEAIDRDIARMELELAEFEEYEKRSGNEHVC